MTPGAVLCIHCGFNRKTRKQLRTVSRRPQDHWYKGGLSYLVRLLLYFLILLLSGGLSAVLARDFSVIIALVPLGLWLVPGALLLGTTQRITVTRTAAGKPVLIRRRLIAFVPAGRTTLDLEPYTTIRPRAEPGGLDAQVIVPLLLLLLLCFVPGLVYLLVRLTMAPPSLFLLEIGGDPDDYGLEQIPRQVVFRGYNEAKMRRAGDALEQIADMRYG
jgi:hypothetical protein